MFVAVAAASQKREHGAVGDHFIDRGGHNGRHQAAFTKLGAYADVAYAERLYTCIARNKIYGETACAGGKRTVGSVDRKGGMTRSVASRTEQFRQQAPEIFAGRVKTERFVYKRHIGAVGFRAVCERTAVNDPESFRYHFLHLQFRYRGTISVLILFTGISCPSTQMLVRRSGNIYRP